MKDIRPLLAELDYTVFELWTIARQLAEKHKHPIMRERARQKLWDSWDLIRKCMDELGEK